MFFMHCMPSTDPQADLARTARCQVEQNSWTAAATKLGLALLARTVRTTSELAPRALVADLVRMGLVERRSSGWLRITDAGRAAFPTERCGGAGVEFGRCWDSHEWGRLGACDSRPEAWRSASASLCRRCDHAPERPRRSRVPVQVVRSVFTTNVAEFDDSKRETAPAIPSLADVMRRAPAFDCPREGGYRWPGHGDTDNHPATRIGYPTGPRIERKYA
jgi:hypothetical protein